MALDPKKWARGPDNLYYRLVPNHLNRVLVCMIGPFQAYRILRTVLVDQLPEGIRCRVIPAAKILE